MERQITLLLTLALLLVGCGTTTGQEGTLAHDSPQDEQATSNPYYSLTDPAKLEVPLKEWEDLLPSKLYHVAFEKGTERPHTGKFKKDDGTGIYHCSVCGNALFDAHTKFESGTGWPSFYQPLPNSLQDQMDLGHGMMRTEVICNRCGAHLGHVFEDGPPPTGLRYCINAVSLDHAPVK